MGRRRDFARQCITLLCERGKAPFLTVSLDPSVFGKKKIMLLFWSDVSALNLASCLSLFLPAKLKPFLQDRTHAGLHASGWRPTALSSHEIYYLLRCYPTSFDRSRTTDIDSWSLAVYGSVGGTWSTKSHDEIDAFPIVDHCSSAWGDGGNEHVMLMILSRAHKFDRLHCRRTSDLHEFVKHPTNEKWF